MVIIYLQQNCQCKLTALYKTKRVSIFENDMLSYLQILYCSVHNLIQLIAHMSKLLSGQSFGELVSRINEYTYQREQLLWCGLSINNFLVKLICLQDIAFRIGMTISFSCSVNELRFKYNFYFLLCHSSFL